MLNPHCLLCLVVTLVSTVLVPILAPKHTMDILISVDAATTVRPKHTYLGSFRPIHLLFIHFDQTKLNIEWNSWQWNVTLHSTTRRSRKQKIDLAREKRGAVIGSSNSGTASPFQCFDISLCDIFQWTSVQVGTTLE